MQSLPVKIVGFSASQFARYTSRQLATFFPVDREADDCALITEHLEASLSRFSVCAAKILHWAPDHFDPMFSSQHASFLYLLANTIWTKTQTDDLPVRLFQLNRALHGIDLYYKIALPPIFLLGHTFGIVLGNTTYGNYFAVFQNSTVGRFGDDKPHIGTGVFMFPNCSIVGRCNVGDRTVLSHGTKLVNANTPGDVTVFQNGSRNYAFGSANRELYELYFRDPEL